MHLAGREDVIVRLVLLEHPPHPLHVVAREAPVAERVDVPHEEFALEAELDATRRPRHLARHERLAATRRLVVEEDAVRGEDAVRLAVVLDRPEPVELRDGIGAARIERRRFPLRHLLHLAVEFGCRGLVEAGLHARETDRLQETHRAERVHVTGEFGRIE